MVANKKTMATTSQFLKSVSILSPLTDEQRETLSTALTETTYEDGDYVVSMGEPADALYLIKSGEVVVHKKAKGEEGANDKDLMRMKMGEFFGESALQSDSVGQTRQANVVAVGKVTALRLTREDFTVLLGDLRELIKHNFNNKVLSGMDMFKAMNSTEKEKFIESLSEVRHRPAPRARPHATHAPHDRSAPLLMNTVTTGSFNYLQPRWLNLSVGL